MTSSMIQNILRLFRQYGDLAYGESVSVSSHSLQAALLAIDKGYDRPIIIAALLHDIGHLLPLDQPEQTNETMSHFGMVDHESIGANFLRMQGLPENICQPIALHVDTKRYLCATIDQYVDQLSEASKQTLRYQGGPMTTEEIRSFRQHPAYTAAIKVRLLDDMAKDPDFVVSEAYWNYFGGLLAEYILAKQNS